MARTNRTVDVRALPGPAVMAAAIEAIVTHQSGSRAFRVTTAVAHYAGLRPSEVVMLRVRSTVLPAEGWGRVEVTEADISFDEPGEPKTGPRSVPIPPVLVAMLSEWIDQNNLTDPERLLFRTRNNTRPSGSNWIRSWHRALESVGQKPLRVYDCRHAAATTWLRAGMPLAETARPTRAQRRNPRLHLRRCTRRRRTHRQPTRRHHPRITPAASLPHPRCLPQPSQPLSGNETKCNDLRVTFPAARPRRQSAPTRRISPARRCSAGHRARSGRSSMCVLLDSCRGSKHTIWADRASREGRGSGRSVWVICAPEYV
ncbi:MAG: site-specific integrase [Ilumatobacteraceae bacterium]|nr:site-specific integrase [Ilumatobacteraceae bacterium]